MNRVLLWGLVGASLGGGLAVLIALYDEAEGQMVMAGDLPLTEDQVRGQLAGCSGEPTSATAAVHRLCGLGLRHRLDFQLIEIGDAVGLGP
jgi:hypothetical protein